MDIGAAAADHVHTAAEVGALPADVSDITNISAISGPDGSVMIDMSAGLTISLDGADKIVVEQSEIHVSSPLSMGGNIIKSVKVPSIASDAANKQYVDGQVATRAPANHSHQAADVGARPDTWVPAASDIISGTLSTDRLPTVPLAKGGTGATTAAAARTALGAAPLASPVFTGTPKAPASSTSYSTAQMRNIYAGTTDMTAGSSSLASGIIYIVYE